MDYKVNPVTIAVENGHVEGDLTLLPDSTQLIIFAHGSGSSRLSPRNRYVADILHQHGFSTLLFDLLTKTEDETYANRFDIFLLTQRLMTVTNWAQLDDRTRFMNIGYFGASTGSAAALQAAARLDASVWAVVSRGGRPDLADPADFERVAAPTLFIVGGSDNEVRELNEIVYEKLICEKKFSVIPGASHLFEEGTTLAQAAKEAAAWFEKHIPKQKPAL